MLIFFCKHSVCHTEVEGDVSFIPAISVFRGEQWACRAVIAQSNVK